MNRDLGVIACENCGIEMWDDEDTQREMTLHEAECEWPDDPEARFEKDDWVQYSNFGLRRLGRDPRVGQVTGFSRDPNLVRVQWADNESSSRLAHNFVKPLEDALQPERYCPRCDDETVHNTHGRCIECFKMNYEQ